MIIILDIQTSKVVLNARKKVSYILLFRTQHITSANRLINQTIYNEYMTKVSLHSY